MRILYLSQYFPPEMGAPAARVHELSRAWAAAGHQVTVLTGFAHHPTGVKARQDRGRLTRRERVDGMDIVRSYVFATPNRGVLRRMLSYASFMVSAVCVGAIRAGKPDVVIATSPQLLCGVAGYLLARRFRAPFVFEVRDLWPESVLAVEAMQDNALVRALQRVAAFLYKKSDRVVTVGEGYKRQIVARYGLSPGKIAVVPNGVDTPLFRPGPRRNEIRAAHDWGEQFVVMYVGTLGMAHGLDTVLDAADRLRERKDIRFVFVGEGAEKERLKVRARERGLPNIQFIDQQPKDRIPLYYAACDLGLVLLRNSPLFQDVLPSKLFEYLAMERPVLVSVGGEARMLVESTGAGEYVPPENAGALAEAIGRLSTQPETLRNMGPRGRVYVLAHHDRTELARAYVKLLHQVAG